MVSNLEMVMICNGNPVNRGAFVEIVLALLLKEEGAIALRQRLCSLCLEDIVGVVVHPVGWHQYLEKGASLVLNELAQQEDKERREQLILKLLNCKHEEVAQVALHWLEKSEMLKPASAQLQEALNTFTVPPKANWEGCCAAALRIKTLLSDQANRCTPLDICLAPHEQTVLRVRDAWLGLSGCAVKKVFTLTSLLIPGNFRFTTRRRCLRSLLSSS
jgi:hypothetical protein